MSTVLRRDTRGLFALLLIRRLGAAAFPVALLLAAAGTRGLAAAALIQGVRVVASIGSTPLRARLIDRFGRRRVVMPQTVLSTLALVGFSVTVVNAEIGISVPLVLILVQTLSAPTMDAVIRSEWQRIGKDSKEVKALHAADSVLEEAGFVLGPVLVGSLILATTPEAALNVSVVVITFGALAVFVPNVVREALRKPVVPRSHEPESQRGGLGRIIRTAVGPIATRELQRIVFPLLFMGTSFGVLAILIPLSADDAEVPGAAGFLFGAISIGGLIGAFVYSALRLESPLASRQAVFTLIVGLPLVPVLFVHHPAALGMMLVLAGLAVTPLYINSYLMMDDDLPESVIHEANTWVPVAHNIGYSTGIFVAGSIAATGVTGVSLAAGGFAVLTAIYALGMLLRTRREPTVAVQEV